MTRWGLNLHSLSSMGLVKVVMLFWTKIVTSVFVSTLFTSPQPPRAFWISNRDAKITQWLTTREPSVTIVWISILLTPGMRTIFGLAWQKHENIRVWQIFDHVPVSYAPNFFKITVQCWLRSFKSFFFFLLTVWVNGSRQIRTQTPYPGDGKIQIFSNPPPPRGCDFCQIPFFPPLIPTLSRGGVYIDSCIIRTKLSLSLQSSRCSYKKFVVLCTKLTLFALSFVQKKKKVDKLVLI